jgi:protein phosphatase
VKGEAMNVYSDTNIGLKRHENQDRVRIYSFNENAKFAVICDGMGGENAGSEASEKAIEVVYDRITKVIKAIMIIIW